MTVKSKPLVLVLGGVIAAALLAVLVALFDNPSNVGVPNLGGLALATAERSLASLGLRYHVVHLNRGFSGTREGIVLTQDPGAGATVGNGTTIQLNVFGTMTNGPLVKTPDLVGTLQWRAENAIADRGLRPVVLGPRHHGSAYQYWTIVSQHPNPGTPLPVGLGTVVIRMEPPAAITVTARLPVSSCSSSWQQGVHVVAAYVITSAQLKLPPISDRGPLSRQSPGPLWMMCYVVGKDAAVSYGPSGGNSNHAVWVFYRNGSLAEVVGQDTPFRFKVSAG